MKTNRIQFYARNVVYRIIAKTIHAKANGRRCIYKIWLIAYLILDMFSIKFAGIMESFFKFNRAGE